MEREKGRKEKIKEGDDLLSVSESVKKESKSHIESVDVGLKYLSPVYLYSQTDYFKPITVRSARILILKHENNEIHVSICAVGLTDQTDDDCDSHNSPAGNQQSQKSQKSQRQQLNFYCTTAVIAEDPGPSDSALFSKLHRVKSSSGKDKDGKDKKNNSNILPMMAVLNLGCTASSCTFYGPWCSIVLSCGVILLDLKLAIIKAEEIKILNKKADAADTLSRMKGHRSLPQPVTQVAHTAHTVPQMTFRGMLAEKSCASSHPCTWSNGSVSFISRRIFDEDTLGVSVSVSERESESVSVVAYRHNNPTLLTVTFRD